VARHVGAKEISAKPCHTSSGINRRKKPAAASTMPVANSDWYTVQQFTCRIVLEDPAVNRVQLAGESGKQVRLLRPFIVLDPDEAVPLLSILQPIPSIHRDQRRMDLVVVQHNDPVLGRHHTRQFVFVRLLGSRKNTIAFRSAGVWRASVANSLAHVPLVVLEQDLVLPKIRLNPLGHYGVQRLVPPPAVQPS
jgi:hypothetical protein